MSDKLIKLADVVERLREVASRQDDSLGYSAAPVLNALADEFQQADSGETVTYKTRAVTCPNCRSGITVDSKLAECPHCDHVFRAEDSGEMRTKASSCSQIVIPQDIAESAAQALKQTIEYCDSEDGKSQKGYFSGGGWAGEQLRLLRRTLLADSTTQPPASAPELSTTLPDARGLQPSPESDAAVYSKLGNSPRRTGEYERGFDAGMKQAALIADSWAKSNSCKSHDDNPCCHVRTGAGIRDYILYATPSPLPEGREQGFFEARIRNQAENLVDSVLGVGSYDYEHSTRRQLRDRITDALLAAHNTTRATAPVEEKRK